MNLLGPRPAADSRKRRPVWMLITLTAFGAVALAQTLDQPADGAEGGPDRLTNRPRPTSIAVRPIRVGDEVQTVRGQRPRVELPGERLPLSQWKPRIKVDQAQQVSLGMAKLPGDLKL